MTGISGLPKVIQANSLWQYLAIQEATSSIPPLTQPLPRGWTIFAGKGSLRNSGPTELRAAEYLARLNNSDPSDWCGLSRQMEVPRGYEGQIDLIQYHFWYDTKSGFVFPHYFKIKRNGWPDYAPWEP